jgi:hypothetical protein
VEAAGPPRRLRRHQNRRPWRAAATPTPPPVGLAVVRGDARPSERGSLEIVEVASFFADDVEALVRASLACPRCLSGRVDWSVAEDDAGFLVGCSCQSCGHERLVGLTDAQALRLAVAPLA